MENKQQLITQITSYDVLEQAYQYICNACKKSSPNNGIWDIRFNWGEYKDKLKDALKTGNYHLSPLRHYNVKGQRLDCWEAQDAIVLKAIGIVLAKILEIEIPTCCTHIKGHGGSKKTVAEVQRKLKEYKFVYKSDIKSFYQSIEHYILLNQLKKKIDCKITLRLIYEYCNRLVDINGEYHLISKGIPLGCPLSPLLGAWFLRELDLRLSRLPVFYRRFMDDWVVLAKTRNHLRKAIKATEKILTRLRVKKQPDKTFIGWIKKGFDFLGYRLTLQDIHLSKKTEERCTAKIVQLYEQGVNKDRIGKYWLNWIRWGKGGSSYQEYHGVISVQILNFGLGIIKLFSPVAIFGNCRWCESLNPR